MKLPVVNERRIRLLSDYKEARSMESQNIEWKESWRDEYMKTICAFANASGGTLETAWTYNRDDRHVAIWMVDRSHFRGTTANFGAHTRSQRLTSLQSRSCEGHAEARLARFIRCCARKLRAGDGVKVIVCIGSDI